MLYLEYKPAAPLDRCIDALWYARSTEARHRRERILPGGQVQIILNLARDFTLDCPEGEAEREAPAALVVGAHSVYQIVDTSDMADLIGILFAPGGFTPFARDAADHFTNRSISLEEVWGPASRSLRDHLRELPTPQARLVCLERFLAQRFTARHDRHPAVEFALHRFAGMLEMRTVGAVARSTGWSERRFSQVFREEVGLSPKTWCRIKRFQRALDHLHAGAEVRWAELALECGFYDQSHFANEFRAFSGVDATTYSARRTPWTNHIEAD